MIRSFLFFNYGAATEIYTLSLHDALPISVNPIVTSPKGIIQLMITLAAFPAARDRKSTRLNSSHVEISYAVFCLKKKTLRPKEGVVRCRVIEDRVQIAAACTDGQAQWVAM